MKMGHLILAGATALVAVPSAASAAITWTDWTGAGSGVVTGNAGAVGVTFSGSYAFAQTNGGTNYWGCGFNCWDSTVAAPPASDIIGLADSGTKTITFSAPVQNVFLALASWNGQANVTFDRSFSQVGWVSGCGFWGCGQLTNLTTTSFTSSGEAHGVLQFAGPVTSLTFTESNFENWHGIQVGIGTVPEPSAWALMILGFAAVGGGLRRRAKVRFAHA